MQRILDTDKKLLLFVCYDDDTTENLVSKMMYVGEYIKVVAVPNGGKHSTDWLWWKTYKIHVCV